MKKIEAILSADNAQRFIDQLDSIEVENLMTTNVRVIDKKNPRKMIYRGFVYEDCSSVRVKVEFDVSDWDAEWAESLLAESCASRFDGAPRILRSATGARLFRLERH